MRILCAKCILGFVSAFSIGHEILSENTLHCDTWVLLANSFIIFKFSFKCLLCTHMLQAVLS